MENHPKLTQGGVTPIDSIVTAATAGQSFDRAYGKAGNGNETETGNGNWKRKPETENRNGNATSSLL